MMERKFKWISGGISLAVIAISVMAFTTLAHSDESCNYCGMSKAKFGHSWVVIENEKGTKGVCSIHCAAIDMALNIDNPIKKMTVGDYNTKNQIDADKAYWVIGGDKGGVMTMRAKWAFQTKDAADAFIKAHGGKPAIFDDVMKAAFEDMYADTLMIQKKKTDDEENRLIQTCCRSESSGMLGPGSNLHLPWPLLPSLCNLG